MHNNQKPQQATHRAPLDWSGSSFGLFMGLLCMVTLIIALILHFALVNQQEYHLVAILINNISGKFLFILESWFPLIIDIRIIYWKEKFKSISIFLRMLYALSNSICIYEWGNHHAKLCQLFTDTVINVLMIFTMLVGFFRIKKLKFIGISYKYSLSLWKFLQYYFIVH